MKKYFGIGFTKGPPEIDFAFGVTMLAVVFHRKTKRISFHFYNQEQLAHTLQFKNTVFTFFIGIVIESTN
jgi:hypothetical protein